MTSTVAVKTDDAASAAESDLSAFSAAAKDSRDAAKWLLAGFGAIAVALAAGTQLSSIGSLNDPPRMVVAVSAVAVGLGAAAAAAAATMWLLLPGYVTFSDIARQEKQGKRTRDFAWVGDVLSQSPEIAEGYGVAKGVEPPTAVDLLRQYQSSLNARRGAYDKYLEAFAGHRKNEQEAHLAFQAADAESANLSRICNNLVTVASFRRINRGAHAWVFAITVLAFMIGVSIGVFAWAANPPKTTEPSGATSLRGVTLSDLDLTGRDLTNVDLSGAHLSNVVLLGATLSESHLVNVTWTNVTCPDGTNTGPIGGSCIGHLK